MKKTDNLSGTDEDDDDDEKEDQNTFWLYSGTWILQRKEIVRKIDLH